MLVLSRKIGEKIFIGDNISVTIVRVAQGVVRLGVEAPAHLPIVREEIIDTDIANVPGSTASAAVPAGFASQMAAERFISNVGLNKSVETAPETAVSGSPNRIPWRDAS